MKIIGKILKIIGILIILILVISLAIAIFLPSEQESKYSNISEMYPKANLNIRIAPGSNYEILKTVKPNTKLLTSDSISNGFKMILNADSTKFGWASERYLQDKPLSESLLRPEPKQQLNAEQPKRKEYSISISHLNFNKNSVEYKIETNIPLPVEVMLSIDLANLKPEESYIGTSNRIKISQSPFTYSLDISNAKLPSGTYETEVTFYSNWGANNGNSEAKKIKTDVTGKNLVELQTSYGTAEERKVKDKKQVWVMENVVMETPWEPLKFIERLGQYEELTVINRNPEIIKVYYFEEADMTIFVNELKDNVVTWRIGKTNRL